MKTKTLLLLSAILLICCTTSLTAQDVSEEARRHVARGQTAAEMAKTNADFEEAINEFRQAIVLAPQWSEPYYQLGVLQDKLGKYEDACINLKRCIQLAPTASNVTQVQEFMYKVEYKRDKTNKRKGIMDALTGGTVQRKGIEGGTCGVTKFMLVGGELKANIGCMVSEYNQIVAVDFDGSVIKLKYIYYGCANMPASYKSFPCPWEVSITAEVISTSPLRFKVKEDRSRQFNGDYKVSYDGEWEFNK